MKAYLTRAYLFSASHRLHSDEFSAEKNAEVYGKCNNPHGHGHNYRVEVTVGGQVDAKLGMVCDLAELDTFVNNEIIVRYSLENLNTLPEFKEVVPTTENLSIEIFNRLRSGFKPAAVAKVRIEETAMNSFEYSAGAELR
jgi:6-pyruvoyltetrahydropterin/6-carboxytetrahydropterin synthase